MNSRKLKKEKYHGESIMSYFGTVEPKQSLPHISLSKSKSPVPTPKIAKISAETRKCPFYKWIPSTNITIDAFNYGLIPGCDYYFLSHFHYDHYRGLSSNFQGKLYCSKVTEGLVRASFGSKLDITGLENNKTMEVGGIEVTTLDANHCPGSVMFLFHVPMNKKSYLHTGDFRYSSDMLDEIKNNNNDNNPLSQFILSGLKIHTLFLDTTYCSPQYDFIPQNELIKGAIQVTKQYLTNDPSALVVCGMYTIGKERFVHGLASELNLKIWLPKQQNRLVRVAAENGCPICQKVVRLAITDPLKAQLHILPMQQINMASLLKYRTNSKPPRPANPFSPIATPRSSENRMVIAWRPTGWTHKPKGKLQSSLVSTLPDGINLENSSNNILIFGAAYSEHSSFNELHEFVTRLRPTRIQPTVFGKSLQTCLDMVNGWLKETTSN